MIPGSFSVAKAAEALMACKVAVSLFGGKAAMTAIIERD